MMENRNAPQIGPILQKHRKVRGLSLEQLALRSGVSKSMLSQIERGQANPTFAVLWGLTRALRINFGELVDGSAGEGKEEAIEIVSRVGIPEMRSADGLCCLRILSPPHLAGATEWYEVYLEPGGFLESTAHAPGACEHLTALAEALVVTSGAESRRVAAGETARYPADVPHRIANESKRRAHALLVVLYR